MNIAAYCRVSTDKADQLNSLEAQKEFFSEYTKRTGDTLVRLYADEGISGTKIKNRKEFLRMMADAEHGLFDMVVVKDISRFARNTVDLLQNVRKLKSLGIETQFLTANMTSMGNSEFVLTIFGALAQEESANTSKRVKFGKKMNAEKGRVPNIVYGYDKTIGDYFNLAINEEEAAVVRQIYEWYIKDGYGAAKISIFLNERGLRTKRNCQWSQNGVCRILTNELYTGKIINGKQEVTDFLTGQRADKDETEWMVVERPDLRIIEPEVFEQAQQIMQSRGKAFKVDKERQSNKYLFSTLIKCKECGWSFRRTVRTYKNTYVRWVCSGHNGRGADNCPNAVTVDEEELIEVLQEYFAELLKAKKNVIRYVVGEFQRVYKAKDENLNYEKELNAQLAKLQKTRQKYMDMYADDLISREELNDKIGGMRKEIERLENELKMVAYHLTKGEQLESVLGRTFKEIEDITDVHQMTNAQLKRIIQKIEVDKDGNVDIYLRLLGDLGLDETVLIHHDETHRGYGLPYHPSLKKERMFCSYYANICSVCQDEKTGTCGPAQPKVQKKPPETTGRSPLQRRSPSRLPPGTGLSAGAHFFFLTRPQKQQPCPEDHNADPGGGQPHVRSRGRPGISAQIEARQDQRSRKRIQAGKDAAFEEQHAVSQEERQDGASQICPTDLSKDQDQGHTDQTCSKGSRHDLRTAMKKHLRSQSRQAGRQSSDQGNAGTVYSQKDCKHAGQKQLCPQKPWHGNRDRHDIFQRIMGRLPVHEPGACHHQ